MPTDLHASRLGKVRHLDECIDATLSIRYKILWVFYILVSLLLLQRQISRDVPDGGNPEKRPRYTKTQSHTSSTGGSRRSAMGDLTNRRCVLGDVTNRINVC